MVGRQACHVRAVIGFFDHALQRPRDRHDRRTADRQRPVGIRDRIVGAGQARGRDRIVAHVDGPLRGAAVSQRTAQHRRRLVVHKAVEAHAIATREGLAVIGFVGVERRHPQGRWLDVRRGARLPRDAVVAHVHTAVAAAQRHLLAIGRILGGKLACGRDRDHVTCDQARLDHSRHAHAGRLGTVVRLFCGSDATDRQVGFLHRARR